MTTAAMKHMASNFAKLDKFEGVDFRRWQKKMHFLLSSMSVVYVLTTPIPDDGDDATVEQIRRRSKWENDDYICRGLILNGLDKLSQIVGMVAEAYGFIILLRYHEDTQSYFNDLEQYKMIKAICRLSCSVCDKVEENADNGSKRKARFRDINQLKVHLFHQHKVFMCSLCLEGRKNSDSIARITRPIGEATASTSSAAQPSASGGQTKLCIDEIQNFIDARFIGPHEACWRIFGFDIHYRQPAVQILAAHLENMQRITFKAGHRLQSILNNPHCKKTTLTEWLAFNDSSTLGRHLTYLNFQNEFMWNKKDQEWTPRVNGNKASVGRTLAKESGMSFVFASCAEFTDSEKSGATRIHQMFSITRRNAPGFMFVDEIDELVSR